MLVLVIRLVCGDTLCLQRIPISEVGAGLRHAARDQ